MEAIDVRNLDNEDKLNELVTEYQKVFTRIDECSEQLREGVYETGQDYQKLLTELTGIYMSLSPICEVLDAEKQNQEYRAFNQIKIDTEKTSDKKFVASAADKEAGEKVSQIRWVRNLFSGYVDATKVAINSCQSIMRYLGDERRMVGQTD